MNNETELNLDRKPTPADLRILAWLEAGNSINNLQAIQQFQNACIRDCAWRLKKAGYPIHAEWKNYETKDGKKKKFKLYFLKPPEIIPTGKTVETNYRKEKSSTQFANEIIESAKNHGATQLSIL